MKLQRIKKSVLVLGSVALAISSTMCGNGLPTGRNGSNGRTAENLPPRRAAVIAVVRVVAAQPRPAPVDERTFGHGLGGLRGAFARPAPVPTVSTGGATAGAAFASSSSTGMPAMPSAAAAPERMHARCRRHAVSAHLQLGSLCTNLDEVNKRLDDMFVDCDGVRIDLVGSDIRQLVNEIMYSKLQLTFENIQACIDARAAHIQMLKTTLGRRFYGHGAGYKQVADVLLSHYWVTQAIMLAAKIIWAREVQAAGAEWRVLSDEELLVVASEVQRVLAQEEQYKNELKSENEGLSAVVDFAYATDREVRSKIGE